ncbi:MAG: hypothetical protein EHM72_11125 [Calditrichaeota bacterium]|nr:MAG: hypothetical protein EHM72_11125 [Calditrichota bacterium]
MKQVFQPSMFLFAILMLIQSAWALSPRQEINLTGTGWRVWLDKNAEYVHDQLFLPDEIDYAIIPVNPPQCGWDALYSAGVLGKVPASFEELFGQGDPTWRYHGVGWFSQVVQIPPSWEGQVVHLSIEKARLRVELYINEQLAGYDLIAETPLKWDISRFLSYGAENRIALRVTNPGGQRGWNDAPATEWGNIKLIPGHDFGGIGGQIVLTATDSCYIKDLFVKNVLPAGGRRIQVQTTIDNMRHISQNLMMTVEIATAADHHILFDTTLTVNVEAQQKLMITPTFAVPEAKLWSPEQPALHYCTIRLNSQIDHDVYQQRFGFRTFEVKANQDGAHHFYLNGERIRIKSAIDWGYYHQTGFYATEEMARKSVENAKAIGHNAINFHRRIGEPLVMKYADELGLLIYEEPGGSPGVDDLKTPSWIETAPGETSYFCAMTFPEKFKRMVLRDRNHPSVIIYSVANEQCTWDYVHKKIFVETQQLDDSRLLLNQSGGQNGGPSGFIPHIRPYESFPRLDYIDDHTVDSKSRFQESDFFDHICINDSCAVYWGEVRCYCGPDNYFLLAHPKDTTGYDYKSWSILGQKTEKYFHQNDFSQNSFIKSPADLSRQVGRGLMYIDGRLGQNILCSDPIDGYAINGWSGADQSLGFDFLAWYSAICDEGRNLKGPAEDYYYWIRDLQVAIRRQNGKYFSVGDRALFAVDLINEGRLPAGAYQLSIKVKDGNGVYTNFSQTQSVEVLGKDAFAQSLIKSLPVIMEGDWHAGYITVEAILLRDGKQVADGAEQVLLQNRPSFAAEFQNITGVVYHWKAAEEAALQMGGKLTSIIPSTPELNFIALGEPPPDSQLGDILDYVKSHSVSMVIKFDSSWAATLCRHKILKSEVTQWGGEQKPYWNGNGWGYLDSLIGDQAIPGKTIIGTNSWEVPSDPIGFAPFESNFPQRSFGAFFHNPDTLLTLIGCIDYGMGTILLAPSYPVDLNNAFSDLLFCNMVKYRRPR